MINENRVPNNMFSVARRVNALRLEGVEAVSDDGAVIVEVSGNANRVLEVARALSNLVLPDRIGDGVQESSELWVNAEGAGFHGDLSDVELLLAS